MMQAQRERLHEALMGVSIHVQNANPAIYAELDDMVTRDVDKIEPMIDEWVREAFQEGKRVGQLRRAS